MVGMYDAPFDEARGYGNDVAVHETMGNTRNM
jgi:hypothetical protein